VSAPPSLGGLFRGFLGAALSGFGGVLPWARRMVVDERGWMSEHEFLDVLALCQVLPGPNIVNVTIAVGGRFHGVAGALVAFLGLMLVPVTLVIALGLLYARFADLAPLRGAFAGVSAVAAGLVVTMALRLARALRGRHAALGIAALAFAATGLLRWPLHWIVLALAPIGIALAASERR
jgi:chromate transporter